MRAFVIADSSKRKARPVAALFWEDADGAQAGFVGEGVADSKGGFSLELATGVDEGDLPLSLSFCARRERGCATPGESEDWVRSRIVPENRHNIVEVLRANGLAEYDEVSLLAKSRARSSDDDFLVYEVSLSDDLAAELNGQPWRRADRLLAAVERKRSGGQVQYAVVQVPSASVAEGENAAVHIGVQIRDRRLKAGLTQKQLAARAGIAQAVLSRVESGAGNPTLALLEDIASALDQRLDVSLRG